MKKIEILGTGCPKCRKLMSRTEFAISELGLDCEVDKVDDIVAITGYGIMMTPALVVDGVVKVTGKVPSVEDIKTMIS
jgi:small redox-active disulfide protein 2